MNDKITRVGVGVFVFKDGKFLIGQRRGSHGTEHWSVPGGHIEFGESFAETATREVMEETGLAIQNVRFGALTNDPFPEEDKHYVSVWMLSDWASGQAQSIECNKFIKLRWCDFDTLPEPLFLPWRQLLSSQFIEAIKQELAGSRQI